MSAFCREPIFRVLLVASLWHAPVPWVHIHGATDSGAASNPILDRHLDEFHANFAPSQVGELGWHMHIVLPWNIHHQGDCEQNRNGQSCDDFLAGVKYGAACAPQNGIAQTHALSIPCGDRWTAVDSDSQQANVLIPQCWRSEGSPPLGYFGSFLDSVSICDLIDRHLC